MPPASAIPTAQPHTLLAPHVNSPLLSPVQKFHLSCPLQDSARLSDDVATIRGLVPLLQSAVKFEASMESVRPNQLGISIANETEKSLEEILAQFSSIEAALNMTGNVHTQFMPPAMGTGQVREQEGSISHYSFQFVIV